MNQRSTFTPASDLADTMPFEEIIQTDGVYGSTNNDPRFVVIQGVCFERDLSTGDFTGVVQSVPAETRFRQLQGTLTIFIEP